MKNPPFCEFIVTLLHYKLIVPLVTYNYLSPWISWKKCKMHAVVSSEDIYKTHELASYVAICQIIVFCMSGSKDVTVL